MKTVLRTSRTTLGGPTFEIQGSQRRKEQERL